LDKLVDDPDLIIGFPIKVNFLTGIIGSEILSGEYLADIFLTYLGDRHHFTGSGDVETIIEGYSSKFIFELCFIPDPECSNPPCDRVANALKFDYDHLNFFEFSSFTVDFENFKDYDVEVDLVDFNKNLRNYTQQFLSYNKQDVLDILAVEFNKFLNVFLI
jgi:hypothetical protein